MSDEKLRVISELLESIGREGKLVDRYIRALGDAGKLDGVTREEALSATRRFTAMVEQSNEKTADTLT